MLLLIGISFVLELFAVMTRLKSTLIVPALLVNAVIGVVAFFLLPIWLAVATVIILGFKVVNILRLQHRYNRVRSTNNVTYNIVVLHTLLLAMLIIETYFLINWGLVLTILLVIHAGYVAWLNIRLHANITKLNNHQKQEPIDDAELPSITVAIPVRNEESLLAMCLDGILKSSYPKLEILVLDDCSHDSTRKIIKKFAHKGVRFIAGSPVSSNWLPKNYAYQQLYEEASGEYIMFLDANVSVDEHSITKIVERAIYDNLDLVNILPRYSRFAADASFPLNRQLWNIVRPRYSHIQSQACWLVKKQALKQTAGFKAVAKSFAPTVIFGTNNKVSALTLAGSGYLGVSFIHDDVRDEFQSMLRRAYPLSKRSPVGILFRSLGLLFLYLTPVVVMIIAQNSLLATVAGVALLMFIVLHVRIIALRFESKKYLARIAISFYYAVAEIVIALASMLKYEFFIVRWKDRNICKPALLIKNDST